MEVICGECDAPMVLQETQKYRYKSGQPRKFWGCSRFPDCKGIHGAHPDGRPLGVPADQETKEARKRAHKAMDLFLKNGMEKGQVYATLKKIFGFDVHIGESDEIMCERIIQALKGTKK